MLRLPGIEPRLMNGFFVPESFESRWQNALRGRARGLELFLQRRSTNGLSGWIGYAYAATDYSIRSATRSSSRMSISGIRSTSTARIASAIARTSPAASASAPTCRWLAICGRTPIATSWDRRAMNCACLLLAPRSARDAHLRGRGRPAVAVRRSHQSLQPPQRPRPLDPPQSAPHGSVQRHGGDVPHPPVGRLHDRVLTRQIIRCCAGQRRRRSS